MERAEPIPIALPSARRPTSGPTLAQAWLISANGSYLAPMAAIYYRQMQEGKIWRVEIVWRNGAVHYFGKFTSKKDATDWINAHPSTNEAMKIRWTNRKSDDAL